MGFCCRRNDQYWIMTLWTLIRRSLSFHARAHFGVVLGAAVLGSAALIGALVVGDPRGESLKDMALSLRQGGNGDGLR